MATTTAGYPRVLLFDIGGVCVISPFQAILDYEKSRHIPLGYINHAISASGPTGAWAQIETGAIPLDEEFFRLFKADLEHEGRWKAYYLKSTTTTSTTTTAAATTPKGRGDEVPPVPNIDAKWLFREMMRIARTPDPHMWPALQKLRKAADASKGELVLAALSNTVIFPRGHEFNDDDDDDDEHPDQQKDKKKIQKKTKKSSKEKNEIRTLKTQIFDLFLSSAHIGLRKPDERIYHYAITRLQEHVRLHSSGEKKGVRMQDVTFLDDIGTNLRTARKLGMNTIKVTLGRVDVAVRELEVLTGLDLGGVEEEGEVEKEKEKEGVRGKARL